MIASHVRLGTVPTGATNSTPMGRPTTPRRTPSARNKQRASRERTTDDLSTAPSPSSRRSPGTKGNRQTRDRRSGQQPDPRGRPPSKCRQRPGRSLVGAILLVVLHGNNAGCRGAPTSDYLRTYGTKFSRRSGSLTCSGHAPFSWPPAHADYFRIGANSSRFPRGRNVR